MGINMPTDEICCTPGATVLDAEQAAALADRLTALADPVRLQILSMIASSDAGEVCACDFVGPIGRSQPTISHHLKVLAGADLVVTERRGRWIWYRMAPDAIDAATDALTAVLR